MNHAVSSSLNAGLNADLKTDVIVVGSGLVGGVLSCALAVHGLSVMCLDAQPAPALLDETYDGRASAIALSCRRILDVIGVWRHLQHAVQPILHIRVTDTDSPLFLHYDHTDIGSPMGYMAENKQIRWAIHQRMEELEAVTFSRRVGCVPYSRVQVLWMFF